MGRGEHCAIGLVAKHGRGSLLFPNRWSHDKSHDAKRFTTELHHIPHTLDSTVRIALLYTTNTLLVSPRSQHRNHAPFRCFLVCTHNAEAVAIVYTKMCRLDRCQARAEGLYNKVGVRKSRVVCGRAEFPSVRIHDS